MPGILGVVLLIALLDVVATPIGGVVGTVVLLAAVALIAAWRGTAAGIAAAVVSVVGFYLPSALATLDVAGFAWAPLAAPPVLLYAVAGPLGGLLLFAFLSAVVVLLAVYRDAWWRGFALLPSRPLRRLLARQYDASAEPVLAISFDARIIYLNAVASQWIDRASYRALGASIDDALPLYDSSGARCDALALRFGSVPRPDTDAFDEPLVVVLRIPGLPDRHLSLALSLVGLPRGARRWARRRRVEGLLLLLGEGERARRLQRRQYHAANILHASVDALISIDASGVICQWNEAACRMFGYEAEDVVGERVTLLVAADREPMLTQAIRLARDGQKLVDRDLCVRSREGREFDVSLAAFAVPPLAGETSPVVLMLRDIDARRIGERRVRHLGAQLVRRAQELQAIFDVAPVGMAIADSPDCQHVRSNLALANMLGLERPAELMLGRGNQSAIWLDGQPMCADASPLRAAVARRAAIEPLELEIRRPDSRSTVMAYGAPVIDQDGSVVGAIAVLVDITAMKQVHAERQRLLAEAIAARGTAEEASRLKEEFLATVSHELRTPLNAMHGWLEIMQRKPDAATQARGLDVIRRNVRAQTRVIEDILDVSAFVTGKARLVVRPVDLIDIARATVDSLRPTADAKTVQLAMRNDVEAAPVNGDPERLQQIIWNLLSNAVKFTSAGGHVTLTVHRDGPQWELIVSDSGEGIDAAFLPYVFDRFRQADSSIERRHPGLGLGLAIVRHLTELHGGRVAVESPGIGRGATFRVHLPVRQTADGNGDGHGSGEGNGHVDGQAAALPQCPAASPLSGRRILIVEDDASAAEMLAHALVDDGALVRIADCAAAAQRCIAEERPDGIVSDLGMPGRDGYGFIADLRAADHHAGHAHLFAVAVTAYARAEDRERALCAGFDDYLIKPVSPSELSERLRVALADGRA